MCAKVTHAVLIKITIREHWRGGGGGREVIIAME